MSHHYFYGAPIAIEEEKEIIQDVLDRYQDCPANDETKAKIYDELMYLKYKGKIRAPFKVQLVEDPSGHHPTTADRRTRKQSLANT